MNSPKAAKKSARFCRHGVNIDIFLSGLMVARKLLLKHQTKGERAMRVDSLSGDMSSQLQTANNAEKADAFQGILESAKQNLAQAQKGNGENPKPASPATTKTAAQELEEFLRKTPIQLMREAILKEMGLTEEDLKHMPPDKRAAIEDAIADRIKKKLLGENKGNNYSSGVPGGFHGSSLVTSMGSANLALSKANGHR